MSKTEQTQLSQSSNRMAGAINILFLTLESPRQVFHLCLTWDNSLSLSISSLRAPRIYHLKKHNYDLQAFTVQLLEENLGSTFGNISVAPAPRDILWQNMKSPAYLWSYIVFFATILIVISCIALSPVIFAKNIQEKVFDILHLQEGQVPRILGMLLNSVLFFTFTLLTPYFVKVA